MPQWNREGRQRHREKLEEEPVVIGQEKLQLMHIGPSGPIYTTIPPHSATARPGRLTPQRLFAGDQQAPLLP